MLKINLDKIQKFQKNLCDKKKCYNSLCFGKMWMYFMQEDRNCCGILTKKIVENSLQKTCQILEPSAEGLLLAYAIVHEVWSYAEEFDKLVDSTKLQEAIILLKVAMRE